MNRTCKNPDCPNAKTIIMMCRVGTDFCCYNCEKTAPRSTPTPKQRPRRRAAPKKDKVKAT